MFALRNVLNKLIHTNNYSTHCYLRHQLPYLERCGDLIISTYLPQYNNPELIVSNCVFEKYVSIKFAYYTPDDTLILNNNEKPYTTSDFDYLVLVNTKYTPETLTAIPVNHMLNNDKPSSNELYTKFEYTRWIQYPFNDKSYLSSMLRANNQS